MNPGRQPNRGSKPDSARLGRTPARVGWPTGWLAGLVVLLLSSLTCANGFGKADPTRVEAAFLRNFAHYVTWPVAAFADEHAPWQICILGNDPFGKVLDETLKGRTEQGRAFVVNRVADTRSLPSCQVAYIGFSSSESRRAALAELARRPVLTVGNAPGFLQEGGMIRFQVSDQVGFGINLDRTNAAALKVPTKVLEVAREIIENGTRRARR